MLPGGHQAHAQIRPCREAASPPTSQGAPWVGSAAAAGTHESGAAPAPPREESPPIPRGASARLRLARAA